MKIGVLAVQGAFIEHEKVLSELGAECVELRKAEDLQADFDGLVLPGGESTVQGKFLRDSNMFANLQQRIVDGLPVLATCAGMILLAEKLEGDTVSHFATMPIAVKRNAYGRQLGSFHREENFKGLGKIPMTFIRAPYVVEAGEGTEILAKVDGHIVAARYKNQLALAFHPELDKDRHIHKLFLDMIGKTA